jgi:hypothetical protein
MKRTDEPINAHLLVQFKINNVCTMQDLADLDMSLRQMVENLIQSEGLFGICEEDYKIINVYIGDNQ